MKMKTAAGLLPLFAAAYLFAFAAPPVYPVAKAVDELNEASKKAGQNAVAYNTFDPFEKVYDFYKSKGTEVQSHRVPRASEKYAAFKFPDTGYSVVISWKEDSKSKGTIIHIGSAPGR
jgi:DNA phosphorothioation-dependent restriction protein DptG